MHISVADKTKQPYPYTSCNISAHMNRKPTQTPEGSVMGGNLSQCIYIENKNQDSSRRKIFLVGKGTIKEESIYLFLAKKGEQHMVKLSKKV